jgi:DNA-binding NarL/FixJ family response regulator
MKGRIRLLLIDDHILFREGLRRLLESEPDFETVAVCSASAEALTVLSREQVDLILLDYELENETGIAFVRSARTAGYQGAFLMVTAGMTPQDISAAVKFGVSGVFLKHNAPTLLLEAIRSVAKGEAWMDPRMESGVERAQDTSDPAMGQARGAKLPPREQQVLRCVFEGLTNKEAAYQLGVSQSSIKATLQALFEKMGVRTRGQLVRIAIERSLEPTQKP